MKKNEIMEKVSGSIHKMGFELKKHSPKILIAVGVVGTVTSAVMACKATTKLSDILEESKEQLDEIHAAPQKEELKDKYDEEMMTKDIALVYFQTGVKIAKLYAPAVVLGTLSLTSVVASNNILRKRNVALAAAFTAVDQGFKEYRGRVVERFGEEVDYELTHNITKKEIEETVIDEKGKEKTVKKTIDVANPGSNEFVKYFTRSNPYWDECEDYIEMFFRSQQNYANDRLRTEKRLVLNDVLDSLGMQKTKAGMVVGWVYTDNPADNEEGDNFVEFHVRKVYLPNSNGVEELAYAIEFNVDGNIYDKM